MKIRIISNLRNKIVSEHIGDLSHFYHSYIKSVNLKTKNNENIINNYNNNNNNRYLGNAYESS